VDKVQKAVSQEEMTILKNVQSLIGELMTASGSAVAEGGDTTGAPVIEEPDQISSKMEEYDLTDEEKQMHASKMEGMDDEAKKSYIAKMEEDDKAKKALVAKDQVSTASDVATAGDNAEERIIDSLSEVNVENVQEVAKAIEIIKALKSQRRIEKAVITSPVMKVVADLATVVKSLKDEQSVTQTAFENILEGLGITEQIKNQKEVKKAEPVIAQDNESVMKFLQTIVSQVKKGETGDEKKVGETVLSNGAKVTKNLTEALPLMFQNYPNKIQKNK